MKQSLVFFSCVLLYVCCSTLAAASPHKPFPEWPHDFRWNSAGPLGDYRCVQIIETADPHTWNDNFFCSSKNKKDPGMKWSSAGPISGMKCTHILEAADPYTWDDNYLCLPSNSPLNLQWSSAGPIAGKSCIQWSEPADPHTWNDNYLCGVSGACASNPCQNGGQCVDHGNGGYQCKCSANWEGKNCELRKLCPAASFSKKGCYKTPKPHTATLLFNRRNQIDWQGGWDSFIEKIVCDCGKAAKHGGYKYFCIEFYGECWGYKDFHLNQPHAGPHACWGKRRNYNTCDDNQKNPICVGTANHGYIYKLN